MSDQDLWNSPLLRDGMHCGVRDGCTTLGPNGSSAGERYRCLRAGVALSDGSYFGKFRFAGPRALENVNRLVLSDVARLPIRRMLSTVVLHADGKVAADAYVVNGGDGYLLLTEGTSPKPLLDAFLELAPDAETEDVTRQLGLLNIDGPFAWELLKELVGVAILGTRYLDVVQDLSVGGIPVTVCRAGKTGEYGYLLAFQANQAEAVMNTVYELGTKYQVSVCDQADIDVCKLENRVLNMEREGRLASNVLELNMRVMVPRGKGDFVGRAATESALRDGVTRRLIGFRQRSTDGKAWDAEFRLGGGVFYRGTRIGEIVNGGYSPTLGCWSGLALMDAAYAYVGMSYVAEDERPIETMSAPFIVNKSLTVRPQEDSFFHQAAP